MTAPASSLFATAAAALMPRRPLTVSEWADANRMLSAKGSAEAGPWRTDRNPPLREPMDCMSARSDVREVVLMFPIQFGKTEVEANILGYTMCEIGGPIMVCLPGEVSMKKWVNQKLNPMIETSSAVRDLLTSTKSRDAANQREFKDFTGGQLYIEHAGSPARLKSTTVRTLLVDEEDEFSANLKTGDDPGELLEGRTSAYPATYRRVFISTPTMEGISRIANRYKRSDQRRFHVPCPHCGELQHLTWRGLHWDKDEDGQVLRAWYVCEHCAAVIDEHYKTEMIAAGRWVAHNPGAKTRGYHINCLYYQFGLGPRWADLAQKWLDVQNDPPRLKTFINDRLAETFEDPATRSVNENAVADRAEPYPLRFAPEGVLVVTAGVDTQDDRLEVQIVGWGRNRNRWILDYAVLPGDPAGDEVWNSLTDLINRPIEHESGGLVHVRATLIDSAGHRTDHVYRYCRQRRIARPMAGYGAKQVNAKALSDGDAPDKKRNGKSDRRGLRTYQVGTILIKDELYSVLNNDAKLDKEHRLFHASEDLPREYFAGLVSEKVHPVTRRYVKKTGVRNEPLDTHVYAFAATYHHDLRLYLYKETDWAAEERRIRASAIERSGLNETEQRDRMAPVAPHHAPARKVRRIRGQ